MILSELLEHFTNYPRVTITGSVEFEGAVMMADDGNKLMRREHPKSTIWIDSSEHLNLTVKNWKYTIADRLVIETEE